MPHLRFRAINQNAVQELSHELVAPLSEIIETDPDNFTFERIETTYFQGGNPVESYPFVEVLWFARSSEVQNRCAEFLTEKIKAKTKSPDVVVVFQVLDRKAYYENGQPFA